MGCYRPKDHYGVKMPKLESLAFIKFFVLDGLTHKEIHPKLTKIYGDSTPCMSTVKKWATELQRCRTSLEYDPRKGRPKQRQNLKPLKKCII
ncbi:hypothetical protein TNCV_2885481 [Trichonephila clavipes]|nr:hypothetical protein TNCV_2885481 [Trichonephila clavipes]